MWEWILYCFAIYGVISLWVQIIEHFYGEKKLERQRLHYIILLRDSGSTIEWVVRSLIRISKMKGKPYTFTFIDFGSQDDTVPIIERLAKDEYSISLKQHQQMYEFAQEIQKTITFNSMGYENIVFIDLRQKNVQKSAIS